MKQENSDLEEIQLTAEEIIQLQKDLKKAEADATEWKDKCSRLAADFENYKRRSQQDLSSWTFATQKKVFQDLLPIFDDFDRAIEQLQSSEDVVKNSWTDGIEMIYQQLQKVIEKNDVTIIPTEGMFNPELHEALLSVDSEKHESGAIVSTVQKGYMIKGQVLRPAKVSVCK